MPKPIIAIVLFLAGLTLALEGMMPIAMLCGFFAGKILGEYQNENNGRFKEDEEQA